MTQISAPNGIFLAFGTFLRKYFNFYTPDFDGTFYDIASSVCQSVCLSVCLSGHCKPHRQLQDLTARYNWSALWEEDAYSVKIGDQRTRSNCHIVGKRCKQDTEWTLSSRIMQLGTIHQHDERKDPHVLINTEDANSTKIWLPLKDFFLYGNLWAYYAALAFFLLVILTFWYLK